MVANKDLSPEQRLALLDQTFAEIHSKPELKGDSFPGRQTPAEQMTRVYE